MSIEARLTELKLTIPEAPPVAGNYAPLVRYGSLLYVSGQVPKGAQKLEFIGKLGNDVSIEQGYAAARLCALNGLAQVKARIGSLDHVQQIIRVGGFVNCTADFTAHPQVINGASDLLVALFGERGKHARTAIGCNALPLGVATEVEILLAIRE